MSVGSTIPADKLKAEFNAICLATGASKPRDLKVEGRQAQGIHFALEFLRQQNDLAAGRAVDAAKAVTAAGKAVVVIGGGETGNDCVQTAINQGARSVHQLEILGQSQVKNDPMHENPEGVDRQWCVATQAFELNGAGVKAITGRRVRWVYWAGGRRMIELPGSEFHLPADLVLLALGYQAAVSEEILQQLHLAVDSAGKLILCDDFTASADGVFVAGDLASGPALVANAIATGRAAAEKIDAYLRIDDCPVTENCKHQEHQDHQEHQAQKAR